MRSRYRRRRRRLRSANILSRPVDRQRWWCKPSALVCSSFSPDLLEYTDDVEPDYLVNLFVGPAVLDQPADDVREVLRRVLHTGDVRHARMIDVPMSTGDLQLTGERVVQADVVTEVRVRAECDVVHADQVDAVLEVVHDRLQRMLRVGLGECGVRRGL